VSQEEHLQKTVRIVLRRLREERRRVHTRDAEDYFRIDPFILAATPAESQTAAYAQTTQDLGRRVSVTWGGRFDRYQFIDQSRFSPRAALSVKLTDKLSWKAATGIYYQQPFFLFLAAFPENRRLLPFRADHYVAGASYEVSPSATFTVEAYRKNYRDYPVSTRIA